MTTQSASRERARTATITHLAYRFGAIDLAMDHINRGTSATEFEAIALERMRNNKQGFKFARAIQDHLLNPTSLPDGYQGECLKHWAGGEADFEPRRWTIPWSVCRDLHVATPGGGGYLTDDRVIEARDILRPYSVTARSGLEIRSGLRSGALLATTTGKATIHWLSDETTEATESTPVIAQAFNQPKIAIGLLEFSRNFMQQADFESWIRRELLNTAGTAIDAAVLNGGGASGEPLGLLNVTGIGTETGASFTHAKALSAKRKVADANADDETISFLAPPATRELLEAREVIANTAKFVWQDDQVADRPARVSTDVPAGTLIAGSWATALLVLWGKGLEIEFNHFEPSKFKAGIVQARVLVSCDVTFPVPAAFCVATGIS